MFPCPVLVVRSVLIRLFILGFISSTIIGLQPGDSLAQNAPTRADVEKAAKVQLPSDPAAIVAVVGNTPILQGEMMPRVDARIAQVLKKSGPIPEIQLKYARVNLMRGILAQAIQNKVMRQAFLLDQVGTEAADKIAEADQRLAARGRQMFAENELPELKKQYKTNDEAELDEKLREKGSSLSARQNEFVDMILGHLYIREKVDQKPSVSLAEVNDYYLLHPEEFMRPHRARWEQLTVLFSRFDSRAEAEAAIRAMGDEAYFGGNMQAVAKKKSQEAFADQGGLHDWTTKGALASEKLDEQIFTIPVNEMSAIIEDRDGLHIIRVLERQEAGVTPISELQDEIRAKLRKEKISKSQRELVETIQDKVPVWSLFPEDTPGALPLPESITRFNNQTSVR